MQNNRVQSSVTVWIASGFSVLTAVVVRFFFFNLLPDRVKEI